MANAGTATASRSSVVWRFLEIPGSPRLLTLAPGPRTAVRSRSKSWKPWGRAHFLPALRPQSPIGEQDSGLSALLSWVGGESSRKRGAKIALLLPLNSPALSAGPGVTHVVVREDPCYSAGAPIAMGMLAGAATGAALGSLMWSPCWF